MIAFFAIVKSFLGHYVGAYEVARDIMLETSKKNEKNVDEGKVKSIIIIFMTLTCWAAAYANPSILGIIDTIAGPIGAAILCILPMYTIHKIPALAQYRGKLSNVFVTIIGVVTLSAMFYSLF